MFNRESETARSPQRGQPSGLLVCATVVTVALTCWSGDSTKGETNGENVKSFGGTWHAISASTGAPMEPAMTETPPNSPSPPATTTPNEKYSY